MEKLTQILLVIDSYIGSSQWFVYLLLGTGLFFTIYLKFPQIRYFGHAVKIVRGKYDKTNHSGDTSHFGALSTALSGTIGTGNIAGVALAIHLGGPSALFWMLVTAVLGMTTKMVEVTLSHKYREKTSDGTIAGGPMYYMKNRLNMKWLAIIFGIATVFSAFGTGCFPQINSITNSFETAFGANKLVVGIILTVLLGLITLGGIKRISKVATMLVPGMAILYFIGGISVLIANYENILPSLAAVFTNIFTGTAASGGFIGAGFAWAFNRGVNRGLFSNEAGQGSAPIAHAAAKTDKSASEGMVAVLEPFIDTVIICFMTGIILLSSGAWDDKVQNNFQGADTFLVGGVYDQKNSEHVAIISDFYNSQTSSKQYLYSGIVSVNQGVIESPVTVLNSRSIAEDIVVLGSNKEPFTGAIDVSQGKILSDVSLSGRSLLHSAQLTTHAFGSGILGSFGGYIIPLSLLLFAFSTALAWSYYGDRAVTFLLGPKWVTPFRITYLIGFFCGSFMDTTILWIFSGVTVALMTIPNLLGILMLHKDMKTELKSYWSEFKDEYPNEKSPKKW